MQPNNNPLAITDLRAYAQGKEVTVTWSWPAGVTQVEVSRTWKKPPVKEVVFKSSYDVARRHIVKLQNMDGGELTFEVAPFDETGRLLLACKAAVSTKAPPVRVSYTIREDKPPLLSKFKSAYIHVEEAKDVDTSLLYYRINSYPERYPMPQECGDEVGPIILYIDDSLQLASANEERYIAVRS